MFRGLLVEECGIDENTSSADKFIEYLLLSYVQWLMHKWGIAFVTIFTLTAAALVAFFGFNSKEPPISEVVPSRSGSTLEERRVELETKRLEVEALRLRAQLAQTEGLDQTETEVVHQEVVPHDPRKEGAVVDAIVAYVDDKAGANLVEPTVVEPLPPSSALAAFEPDEEAYGDFRGALEPFGDWFEAPDYGPIWQPDDSYLDAGWQPYTNGSWAYSEYGWTWESDDPFGWACDHYGRWLDVRDRGWCWVPGREWAPAWVSWRSNGKHIGWAALPPCATFNRNIGFGGWVDAHCGIGPGHYHFVSNSDFGARNCRQVIVNRSQNARLVADSENITKVRFHDGTVHNHGPDFKVANRRSVHRIHRCELDPEEERRAVRLRIAAARDRSASTLKRVALAEVRRGWDEVTAYEDRVRLRRKIQTEGRGALAAPRKMTPVFASKRQARVEASGGLPRPTPAAVRILQKRGTSAGNVAVSERPDQLSPSTGSDHLDAEQARQVAALAAQNDYQAQRQKMMDDRLAREAEARARLEAHIKVRQDRIAQADREIAAQKLANASRRESSSVAGHRAAPRDRSRPSETAPTPRQNQAPARVASSPSKSDQSSSMFSRTKPQQRTVVRDRGPQRQAQPKKSAAVRQPVAAAKSAAAKPATAKPAAPARAKTGSRAVRSIPQKRKQGR